MTFLGRTQVTKNKVDLAVDVAFEALPVPLENAVKKSGLDDVSMKIIVSQIKQETMVTEKIVEGTIEKSRSNTGQ